MTPIGIRALADAGGYKLILDPSAELEISRDERKWLLRIPCKYGHIGVHGPDKLTGYCTARRLFAKLLAIPDVYAKQTGDIELRVTFPESCLDAVAEILKARKRRRISDDHKQKLVAASARHRFSAGLASR